MRRSPSTYRCAVALNSTDSPGNSPSRISRAPSLPADGRVAQLREHVEVGLRVSAAHHVEVLAQRSCAICRFGGIIVWWW